MKQYTIPFKEIALKDLAKVGGKNASLGEMIRNLSSMGVAVPGGFAITVDAFYDFLSFNCLSPHLQQTLDRLDRSTLDNLSEVGSACREIILRGGFPEDVRSSILKAYDDLEKK